jgi:(S)-2-hydroxy-acid oxidase
MPVVVCPMAMQQMASPDGELAVSRACKDAGCVMIVSTMSNYSLEDIAAACGAGHLWFQLYVFKCALFCAFVPPSQVHACQLAAKS